MFCFRFYFIAKIFSDSVQNEWPAFDWLHVDCLPMLLQLALMLSSTEDSLRSRLTKVVCILSVSLMHMLLHHVLVA
jgi:hypothetical protein